MIDKIYSFSEIIDRIQKQVYLTTGHELTPQEQEILKGTWNELSYDAIAQNLYLNDGYVRIMAANLWKLLSKVFGQKFTKPSFRHLITNIFQSNQVDLNNENDLPSKKGNILVVDDGLESVTLISRLLKKNGYHVSAFTNGKDGLNFLQEKKSIDLIILDIIIPDINGYELCKKIKSNKMLNKIPIIFISSFNDSENKIQSFKLGASDYISKPFDPHEILTRIEYHISCYKKQLELYQKIEEYERQLSLLSK